jgi:hypothetical protein
LPLFQPETIYESQECFAEKKAAARLPQSNKRRSAAEMRKEPREERKDKAEEEAGYDGKIESGVLAAVDDVAREAAQAERKLGTEVENRADEDEESAQEENGAAEFTKGIHEKEFKS